MNPSESDNSAEVKIDQVETQNIPQSQEISPVIKTEENQANWKTFREQREADRKARIEFEKKAQEKAEEAAALRAALEAITNKPVNPYSNQGYEESEESEESRIEKRVVQIIEERERKKEDERQKQDASEYPKRLMKDYKDFNSVCSTENLDYLEFHYPEVAAPFKYMPEGYEKWAAIYLATKRFVPNMNSSTDSMKVDKNLSKPGSISQSSITPQGSGISSARLEESKKAANWERMQRTLKGVSN